MLQSVWSRRGAMCRAVRWKRWPWRRIATHARPRAGRARARVVVLGVETFLKERQGDLTYDEHNLERDRRDLDRLGFGPPTFASA